MACDISELSKGTWNWKDPWPFRRNCFQQEGPANMFLESAWQFSFNSTIIECWPEVMILDPKQTKPSAFRLFPSTYLTHQFCILVLQEFLGVAVKGLHETTAHSVSWVSQPKILLQVWGLGFRVWVGTHTQTLRQLSGSRWWYKIHEMTWRSIKETGKEAFSPAVNFL